MTKSLKHIISIFFGISIFFSSCSREVSDLDLTTAVLSLDEYKLNDQQVDSLFKKSVYVPIAGNSFLTEGSNVSIGNSGLGNWNNASSVISTYIYFEEETVFALSINGRVLPKDATSKIQVKFGNLTKEVSLEGMVDSNFFVGNFQAKKGYNKISIQGVEKTKGYFGDISNLVVHLKGDSKDILFANNPRNFRFSRRGPSGHLRYTIPTKDKIEYYYSEITVPAGEDKIGSYFMANGFTGGYFGIQVNSATERRILFSVWSPYVTDNPNEIPEDQRIKLNKKGDGVITNDFGNEGSGGQSYLIYNWKAENTYKFLLKGKPDTMDKTDYTAWIYIPEQSKWVLIASFKRPKTNSYLNGFYSFLENFSPDNGYLGRQATYGNQWVFSDKGDWHKIQTAKFTADSTYLGRQRIDVTGGVNSKGFYLKNGGFFSDGLAPNSSFDFSNTNGSPAIEIDKLP